MLGMNYGGLFRYRNKSLGVSVDNTKMEASAGFISRIDPTTSLGAELVFNLEQHESYANLVIPL